MKIEDLKIEYDANGNFEMDAIQNELLMFYIRADRKFRQAYSTNYTTQFFQFLKDKARLQEPIHLAIMGNTRSGKSYSGITICFILNLLYGRVMDVRYVCANSFDYLEKLKEMDMDDLKDSCFLIDEEKSVFGTGSMAKKSKLTDVQNIIAKQNISTLTLCPTKFANQTANYGLRSFGRDFKNKVNRFMLYNLQEGDAGSNRPLGMVFLPIFTQVVPEPQATELEKAYVDKKDEWIEREVRGEGDVLYKIKRKSAQAFADDDGFKKVTKKAEKLAYISNKLGSEWTKADCDEIFNITSLIMQGLI